jgi:RHS repeat-associated protein
MYFFRSILIVIGCSFAWLADAQLSYNHTVGMQNNRTAFAWNQVPDQVVEVTPPQFSSGTVAGYHWEQSTQPLGPFSDVAAATGSTLQFTAALPQTTYVRRRSYNGSGETVYSNIVKITLTGTGWEAHNYVRETSVHVPGITTQSQLDGLSTGDKLVTTTYIDGLGRQIQQVSAGIVTPATAGGYWGDLVQFTSYDAYGRVPKQFLPYPATVNPGKFKDDAESAQPAYYNTAFGENAAYSQVTFEPSPLDWVTNIKKPGDSWAAANGVSEEVYVNKSSEDNQVPVFSVDYNTTGEPLQISGTYSDEDLLKQVTTDENGKMSVTYTNKEGQVILTKTQLADAPADAYDGWICVFSVYDAFGRLRYRLQPEAVKVLYNNGFNLGAVPDKDTWLAEQVFQYQYDVKGRQIWKKAPGAKPLRMLYDVRDRLVMMQDGNQAAKSLPEWTVNLYDELDRLNLSTLYYTNKTITSLQQDIDDAAGTTGYVTVQDQGRPVINLSVSNRETTITAYQARNTIEFLPGFSSVASDAFTAEIKADAAGAASSSSMAFWGSPVTESDLGNAAVTTILKYHFYDNYTFAGARTFDNGFINTQAYATGSGILPLAPGSRNLGFSTGDRVRVLGTNTFIATTLFYDENGLGIQSNSTNIKEGEDVYTTQYKWDGTEISTDHRHSVPQTGFVNFHTLTKNVFDPIGRITSIEKKIGSNAFKAIAAYAYDAFGRIKTKRLDPGYTGSGKNELESLEYSYNIQGNITGINKDYALKKSGVYNKWGHFFGLYLGYDNKDGVFAHAALDGHVTGLLWNTQGDDAQRKYDFTYDNAGRLSAAQFRERQTTGDAWATNRLDFSVTGTGGAIGYDLNGNLQSLIHKGIVPGLSAPVEIDNLAYTYGTYSNKLLKVTDNTTQTATNGQQEDFKDGSNTGNDYVYDDNGNLVVDLNKNIVNQAGGTGAGIAYNFLDKPETIRLVGKGTIRLVYDANGSKLQKQYTAEGSSTTTLTSYLDALVYKKTVPATATVVLAPGGAVDYINFEEGRIRVMTPTDASDGTSVLHLAGNMALPADPAIPGVVKSGAWDYFVRDYQGNVRLVLTEEVHTGSALCSMEEAREAREVPVFGQAGSGNEVLTTRYDRPQDWQNPEVEEKVSRLERYGNMVGPNVLLKVMAGDEINATTQYFYRNNVSNAAGGNGLGQMVLSALSGVIGGPATAGTLVHGQSANIVSQLGTNAPFTGFVQPDINDATSTQPKAYLSVLFFDERFNFVGDGSAMARVEANRSGEHELRLTLAGNTAPKNGYAFVYVSNESEEPVYFDNLQVAHNRGHIIEENHYYAYGLRIGGISSKKVGSVLEGALENKNLYNEKELIEDGDLGWYDYGFRMYDAQTGRFPQLDPLTHEYPELTNYQYASCEPIANIDIDGLEGGSSLPAVVVTSTKQVAVRKVAEEGTKRALIRTVALTALDAVKNRYVDNATIRQNKVLLDLPTPSGKKNVPNNSLRSKMIRILNKADASVQGKSYEGAWEGDRSKDKQYGYTAYGKNPSNAFSRKEIRNKGRAWINYNADGFLDLWGGFREMAKLNPTGPYAEMIENAEKAAEGVTKVQDAAEATAETTSSGGNAPTKYKDSVRKKPVVHVNRDRTPSKERGNGFMNIDGSPGEPDTVIHE